MEMRGGPDPGRRGKQEAIRARGGKESQGYLSLGVSTSKSSNTPPFDSTVATVWSSNEIPRFLFCYENAHDALPGCSSC